VLEHLVHTLFGEPNGMRVISCTAIRVTWRPKAQHDPEKLFRMNYSVPVP
jgi:hypothetical protein